LSRGGGISIRQSANVFTINNSILQNNSADVGGGVDILTQGEVIIEQSTINLNEANIGGGINFNHYNQLINGGELQVINSTLSENTATIQGGSLNKTYGELTINYSTLFNNSSPSGSSLYAVDNSKIHNSIIASDMLNNCVGPFISYGYNLENANTCGFSNLGDMVNTPPLVAPIQINGGTTPTHALLDNSPAIDKGDPLNCLVVDQRGFPRPINGIENSIGGCDIGSFEYNSSLPSLYVEDASVVEKDVEAAYLPFNVKLSGPHDDLIMVNFSTIDVTAFSGIDYVKTEGTLTFSPGEISKTISVPVFGDFEYEPFETIILELSEPTNTIISGYFGKGIIFDNENPIYHIFLPNILR
jgi:hypothetical protein